VTVFCCGRIVVKGSHNSRRRGSRPCRCILIILHRQEDLIGAGGGGLTRRGPLFFSVREWNQDSLRARSGGGEDVGMPTAYQTHAPAPNIPMRARGEVEVRGGAGLTTRWRPPGWASVCRVQLWCRVMNSDTRCAEHTDEGLRESR